MKKLLPMLLISLVLFGCKKSSNNTEAKPEVKKYDVTFKVSDFSQTVGTFNVSTNKAAMAIGDTLKNYVNYLNYVIFNAEGKAITYSLQGLNTPNFGTITEKLPTGTYNVFIGASRNQFGMNFQSPKTFDNASYGGLNPSLPGGFSDIFAKTITLNVGKEAITQSVRLERTVGGLDIIFLDEVPANLLDVTFILENEATTKSIKTGDGINFQSYAGGLVNTVDPSEVGKRNLKYFKLIGNTETPFSIRVIAKGPNNITLVDKIIGPVRVYRNQKSTLTGYLFSPTQSSFNVVVNPTWNPSGAPVTF